MIKCGVYYSNGWIFSDLDIGDISSEGTHMFFPMGYAPKLTDRVELKV